MPSTKATAPRRPRRAILPYVPSPDQSAGVVDKTQAYWPWYLTPWQEPDVSPECRAFVLGEIVPDDDEEKQLYWTELTQVKTVHSDARTCIVQAVGAASAIRQEYYAKGMRLISPTTGEMSGGPQLDIYPPQLESGYSMGNRGVDPYIGINDIVEELKRRQPWALAQLDAKINEAIEMASDSQGEERGLHRRRVAALRRRRAAVENGIPTARELQIFFKQFELQRLRSQEDQRLKAQQALQGRIASETAAIARLSSEMGDWTEPELVPA